MNKSINLQSIILLVFICSLAAFGQTDTEPVKPVITATRGIKNKPYSAESIRETVKTLADGNKITETVKGLEYRDSEGRTRREEVNQIPPRPYFSTSINIYDPVGGYSYSLIPGEKTVFRVKLSPPRQFSPLEQPAGYSRKTESLGNRIIEGIETRGSRGISTIAPGTIGNEKEIQTVSEGWFSEELRLTLLSITNDPRLGVSTMRLTNIQLSEPDKSLFEIPADYKIIDREPFRPPVTPANGSPNESKKP